jgi:hypothetical protein
LQESETSQAAAGRGSRKIREKNPLRGLMFDTDGNPYTPVYTNKSGKQYRYYQIKYKEDFVGKRNNTLIRLPSHEIESRIEKAIRDQLSNLKNASTFLGILEETNQPLLKAVVNNQEQIPARDLLMDGVNRVIVYADYITIELKMSGLMNLLYQKTGINIPLYEDQPETKEIKISYIARRAHKGSIIIESSTQSAGGKDPFDLPAQELKNLVRGMIWRDEHFKGETIRQIALREKFSEGFVGKCIFRTFELT